MKLIEILFAALLTLCLGCTLHHSVRFSVTWLLRGIKLTDRGIRIRVLAGRAVTFTEEDVLYRSLKSIVLVKALNSKKMLI